jgi:hypothetical protein
MTPESFTLLRHQMYAAMDTMTRCSPEHLRELAAYRPTARANAERIARSLLDAGLTPADPLYQAAYYYTTGEFAPQEPTR